MNRVQYTGGMRLGNLCVLLVAALLCGCSTVGFYSQAAAGQMRISFGGQAVDRVLADPESPALLRARLRRAEEVLRFAERELGLPAAGRYRRYVDLDRPYVVWNVVAAPELSLTAHRWCYPIVGCAPYRGYFSERRADRLASRLKAQGLEVSVSGAAAYSTLGWLKDPLLSTFVGWSDGHLADLLIHELTHSRVWLKGDVRMNESLASFVGERGARMFLSDKPTQLSAYLDDLAARAAFNRWARELRAALREVYDGDRTVADKRAQKAATYSRFQRCYDQHREQIGGGRYDRAVKALNNARLALISTYNSYTPAFERLFAQAGGSWEVFFAAVEQLGALSVEQRREQLRTPAQINQAPLCAST